MYTLLIGPSNYGSPVLVVVGRYIVCIANTGQLFVVLTAG